MYFKPAWVSAAMLKAPTVENNKLHKGALILNQVDPLVQMFPDLKNQFIIIERRGWHGMNDNAAADIKLVEDSSTLEDTRARFPHAVLLDIGPADFVDNTVFRPLAAAPKFDVIQISCWSKRKRIGLFVEAAALLPHLSFLQLGHFEDNGNAAEIAFRDDCIRMARERGANISFPHASATQNASLPTTKEEINSWINQARVGVLTTGSEGINRFKMECLSADRPMIVCNDVCIPTRKHINDQTGVLAEPTAQGVAEAISNLLQRREQFQPRQYLLSHTGKTRSVEMLKDALRCYCRQHDALYHFDAIDWDGRNESLSWGTEAIDMLTFLTQRYAGSVNKGFAYTTQP